MLALDQPPQLLEQLVDERFRLAAGGRRALYAERRTAARPPRSTL